MICAAMDARRSAASSPGRYSAYGQSSGAYDRYDVDNRDEMPREWSPTSAQGGNRYGGSFGAGQEDQHSQQYGAYSPSGASSLDDSALLPDFFSALVDCAREQWVPLDAASQFLSHGARRAVEIIHDAVGPVGPPVRPTKGSLFIVDEKRLPGWRDDGYSYDSLVSSVSGSSAGIVFADGTVSATRVAPSSAMFLATNGDATSPMSPGSNGVPVNRDPSAQTLSLNFIRAEESDPSGSGGFTSPLRHASALLRSSASASNQHQGGSGNGTALTATRYTEQNIVIEWSRVSNSSSGSANVSFRDAPAVHLQRRALRLPSSSSFAQSSWGGGDSSSESSSSWIWLVQYLEDAQPPRYTPQGQPLMPSSSAAAAALSAGTQPHLLVGPQDPQLHLPTPPHSPLPIPTYRNTPSKQQQAAQPSADVDIAIDDAEIYAALAASGGTMQTAAAAAAPPAAIPYVAPLPPRRHRDAPPPPISTAPAAAKPGLAGMMSPAHPYELPATGRATAPAAAPASSSYAAQGINRGSHSVIPVAHVDLHTSLEDELSPSPGRAGLDRSRLGASFEAGTEGLLVLPPHQPNSPSSATNQVASPPRTNVAASAALLSSPARRSMGAMIPLSEISPEAARAQDEAHALAHATPGAVRVAPGGYSPYELQRRRIALAQSLQDAEQAEADAQAASLLAEAAMTAVRAGAGEEEDAAEAREYDETDIFAKAKHEPQGSDPVAAPSSSSAHQHAQHTQRQHSGVSPIASPERANRSSGQLDSEVEDEQDQEQEGPLLASMLTAANLTSPASTQGSQVGAGSASRGHASAHSSGSVPRRYIAPHSPSQQDSGRRFDFDSHTASPRTSRKLYQQPEEHQQSLASDNERDVERDGAEQDDEVVLEDVARIVAAEEARIRSEQREQRLQQQYEEQQEAPYEQEEEQQQTSYASIHGGERRSQPRSHLPVRQEPRHPHPLAASSIAEYGGDGRRRLNVPTEASSRPSMPSGFSKSSVDGFRSAPVAAAAPIPSDPAAAAQAFLRAAAAAATAAGLKIEGIEALTASIAPAPAPAADRGRRSSRSSRERRGRSASRSSSGSRDRSRDRSRSAGSSESDASRGRGRRSSRRRHSTTRRSSRHRRHSDSDSSRDSSRNRSRSRGRRRSSQPRNRHRSSSRHSTSGRHHSRHRSSSAHRRSSRGPSHRHSSASTFAPDAHVSGGQTGTAVVSVGGRILSVPVYNRTGLASNAVSVLPQQQQQQQAQVGGNKPLTTYIPGPGGVMRAVTVQPGLQAEAQALLDAQTARSRLARDTSAVSSSMRMSMIGGSLGGVLAGMPSASAALAAASIARQQAEAGSFLGSVNSSLAYPMHYGQQQQQQYPGMQAPPQTNVYEGAPYGSAHGGEQTAQLPAPAEGGLRPLPRWDGGGSTEAPAEPEPEAPNPYGPYGARREVPQPLEHEEQEGEAVDEAHLQDREDQQQEYGEEQQEDEAEEDDEEAALGQLSPHSRIQVLKANRIAAEKAVKAKAKAMGIPVEEAQKLYEEEEERKRAKNASKRGMQLQMQDQHGSVGSAASPPLPTHRKKPQQMLEEYPPGYQTPQEGGAGEQSKATAAPSSPPLPAQRRKPPKAPVQPKEEEPQLEEDEEADGPSRSAHDRPPSIPADEQEHQAMQTSASATSRPGKLARSPVGKGGAGGFGSSGRGPFGDANGNASGPGGGISWVRPDRRARFPPPTSFTDNPAALEAITATLRGWRVRRLMRTKKVGDLCNRVRDSYRLFVDMRQQAAQAGGSEDPLMASVRTQLRGEVAELQRLFVDNDGLAGIVELSTILRAQSLMRAKNKNGEPAASAAAEGGKQQKSAEERAAERKQRLKGGAMGKAVIEKYSKINKKDDDGEKDEAETDATAADGGASAPAEKPWARARGRASSAANSEAGGSVDVVVTAPPHRQSSTAGKGASSTAASSGNANNGGLPDGVKPSASWRVLVEIISAQNLAPAAYVPGTLAKGPGIAKSGKVDPDSLEPDPDARDTYSVVYLAQSVATGAGSGSDGESAEKDSGKVKPLSKKMQTPVATSSLSPVWNKRFLFNLPARASASAEGEGAPAVPDFRGLLARVEVYDSDRFTRGTFMGYAQLPLETLTAGANAAANNKWCVLQALTSADRVRGQVNVKARLIAPDPAMIAAQQQQKQAENDAGADGNQHGHADENDEGTGEHHTFLKRKSANPRPQKVDYSHVAPRTHSQPASSGGAHADEEENARPSKGIATGRPSIKGGKGAHVVRMYKIPDYSRVTSKVAEQAGLAQPSGSAGGNDGPLSSYSSEPTGFAPSAAETNAGPRKSIAGGARHSRDRDLDDLQGGGGYRKFTVERPSLPSAGGAQPSQLPRPKTKGGKQQTQKEQLPTQQYISQEDMRKVFEKGLRGGPSSGKTAGQGANSRGSSRRSSVHEANSFFPNTAVEYTEPVQPTRQKGQSQAQSLQHQQSQQSLWIDADNVHELGPLSPQAQMGYRTQLAAASSRIPVPSHGGRRSSTSSTGAAPTTSGTTTAAATYASGAGTGRPSLGGAHAGGDNIMESIGASIDRFFSTGELASYNSNNQPYDSYGFDANGTSPIAPLPAARTGSNGGGGSGAGAGGAYGYSSMYATTRNDRSSSLPRSSQQQSSLANADTAVRMPISDLSALQSVAPVKAAAMAAMANASAYGSTAAEGRKSSGSGSSSAALSAGLGPELQALLAVARNRDGSTGGGGSATGSLASAASTTGLGRYTNAALSSAGAASAYTTGRRDEEEYQYQYSERSEDAKRFAAELQRSAKTMAQAPAAAAPAPAPAPAANPQGGGVSSSYSRYVEAARRAEELMEQAAKMRSASGGT